MTIGFIFWLIMLLWILFGLYWSWPKSQPEGGPGNYGILGGNLMLFVLLFLLGWRVFGFIVQG